MRIINVKNIDTVAHTWGGKIYQPNEDENVDAVGWPLLQKDNILFNDLVTKAQISDGTSIFSTKVDAWNWILGNHLVAEITNSPPFAHKVLPDGKKLFRRKHGITIGLTPNETTNTIFTVPYNYCKINEVEAVGGVHGDYVNLKVLDSANGDYSGTPNAVLTQFGFNVFVTPEHYKDKCNYDADLYLGMQIKIEYTNSQNDTRNVFANFGLHEVKD